MSTADEERIKEDMAEEQVAEQKRIFEELSAKVEALKELENPYAKIEAGLTDEEEETVKAITGAATPEPTTVRRVSAGTPIVGHSISTTSHSGITGGGSGSGIFGPGGITTSPPFAPYPGTTTSPHFVSPLPAVPPPTKKSKKNRFVRLPARFTEKVLLAFVDEDDPDAETNVVWAAHLRPSMIELNSETGEMELVIRFSMEDCYDNNPED